MCGDREGQGFVVIEGKEGDVDSYEEEKSDDCFCKGKDGRGCGLVVGGKKGKAMC